MVVTPDRVAVGVPAITGVDAAVFTVPTDAPEADGTLAWDATTMVLVTAQAGSERGIGWTYGAAAARWVVADQLAPVVVPNLRHIEYFHDHQRIERMLFDGALDPAGGVLRPDPARPGLGMQLRTADAER